MDSDEKRVLLELKTAVTELLYQTDIDILTFSPTGDDEHYSFLIKKAIEYRDTLIKIENRLKEL